MDPLYFEQILIKLLFFNENVRDKVFPFLNVELFDKIENKNIVKKIINFHQKYQKFPNVKEMKIEIAIEKEEERAVQFLDIIETDISDYQDEFILDTIEKFFKEKLIFHEIVKSVEILKSKDDKDFSKLNNIPENIRSAIAFSFDTNIGMQPFTDNGKERLWDHLHKKDEVVPTGLKSLDEKIGGGFHKKSVSVLLGQGNIGKTLIACGITANAILRNKKVLYITLELTEEYITQRIIQNLLDINQFELKELKSDEFNKRYDNLNKRIGNLLTVKKYSPGINSTTIRMLLKELNLKNNFIPDLLIVDYLGELDSVEKGNNSNDTGKFKCQDLEGIAFDYDIPVVTPAQVNRGGYSKSSLDPTEVADSIGIFTETDLVIGITQTQEQYEANPSTYTLDIMKSRFSDRLQRVSIGVERSKMKIFTLDEIAQIYDENQSKENKNEMLKTLNAGKKEDIKIKLNNFYIK